MSEIAMTPGGTQGLVLPQEVYQQKSREYKEASRAPNTRRAYQHDWASFEAFCYAKGVDPLPATADTVSAYIIFLRDGQGLKLSSIRRYLSSVSMAHKARKFPAPTQDVEVQSLLDGMKRVHGVAATSKAAATLEKIQSMMDQVPETPLGIRDRALLLLGFAGAFRRSELVGLNFEDITETKEGLEVVIRRSKTDQHGEGKKKAITYGVHWVTCPVRAWFAWKEVMASQGICDGAVFRSMDRHGHIKDRLSGKAVALVVKRYAVAAGLDATQFAGHSLRSGFVTTAVANGASDHEIMFQTGHKSRAMVDRYVQQANLFKQNAVTKLGL